MELHVLKRFEPENMGVFNFSLWFACLPTSSLCKAKWCRTFRQRHILRVMFLRFCFLFSPRIPSLRSLGGCYPIVPTSSVVSPVDGHHVVNHKLQYAV